MTTFELNLNSAINGESSRANGKHVRERIVALLKEYDVIKIDLQSANLTPSVADELIGGLAEILGAVNFKKKIKILNATITDMALIEHVIGRRVSASKGNNGM